MKELENLETQQGRVLCWMINYQGISIGLVYLFHINKIENGILGLLSRKRLFKP